jgi:hypothetical protein
MIIVIAAIAFGVIAIVANTTAFPVAELLALVGGPLHVGTVWQVVTYVLVEPPTDTSIVWVAISLLFVWLVVSPFELRHGPRRTWLGMLVMTLAGGVGGALLGFVVSLFHLPGGVAFGLGAPVYGMLVAGVFGSGQPMVLLFGRVPLRPMQVAWLLVAFSVFQFLAFTHDAAMIGADLAAIGAGVLYGKWLLIPARPSKPKPRKRPSHLHAIQGGRTGDDEEEDDRPRWLN